LSGLKVCVISFSDLRKDPRVRRQLFALKDRYDVTALGLKKSGIEGIREFVLFDSRTFYRKIASRLIFLFARLWKFLYKHYIYRKYPIKETGDILKGYRFDLVVANELDSLVIAHSITRRTGAKILFDAHEYEPKMIEDRWFHRLFINPYKDFLCRKYLPYVDTMTTVSYGIAEEFNRVYSVRPLLIMNTPEYKKVNLKDVDRNNIYLIHHGLDHPSRKLENMIKLMPLLEKKFNLTLMLVGRYNKYMNHLNSLSSKLCPEKVFFRKPVSFEEIVQTIARYDIGLIIIEPTSLKLKYALPNKLFEFIMAGLCVVTVPLPDIKRIIEEFDCGFVTNSFKIEDIAEMINSLTLKDIMEKKKASLKAAKVLNARMEMKKFNEIVKNLIGD
jgi:glycosyltransferase involved in cell wall biosynthesis